MQAHGITLSILFFLCGLTSFCVSAPLDVFVVPHSHWDVGWLKTPLMYYREDVLNVIRSVMEALRQNSNRTFIFSEVAYMEKWWKNDASPQDQAEFRHFLNEKRIEFVLGGWTMPDEALNTYYALVQTLTRGHEWIRDTFGVEHLPKTAWRIDPFGLSTTMTKIYHNAGFEDTIIMRIPFNIASDLRKNKTMEIMWQTSDSKVFTHIMDFQYCVAGPFERWTSYEQLDSHVEELIDEIEKKIYGS
jgi:hypothetical protein